jgi:pimeloyl-ACP methyl ester carboxylesterase
MAHFLLIHGSCHGAWCWRDVLAHLRAAGHGARAIDLPGHGADPTPVAEVTLEGYARTILAAIETPVVLVGHSMAGYAISLAAELAPEKIAKLVYLCAYVPVPGMTLAEMRRAGPRQPLRDAIVVAEDRLSFTIHPALARDRFYHDCAPQTAAFAVTRLGPQAIRPQETRVSLGTAWQGVEKHYIRCTEDRTIPPEYQRDMSTCFGKGRVSDLPSSHSPFLSMPDRLAQRLIEIAESR